LFLTFSSSGRDYNQEGREEKIKREDGKLMQAYNRMQTFIKIDDDMKVLCKKTRKKSVQSEWGKQKRKFDASESYMYNVRSMAKST
jgi:uncharacterized protein YjhX (UPF0386 family)